MQELAQPRAHVGVDDGLGRRVDLDRQQLPNLGHCSELPAGENSFFRQLDFIIATMASEEFNLLYAVKDAGEFMALKDAIFARYRTLAEMAGVVLLEETPKPKRKRYAVCVVVVGLIVMFILLSIDPKNRHFRSRNKPGKRQG